MISDEDRIYIEIATTPRSYHHFAYCVEIASDYSQPSEIAAWRILRYARSVQRFHESLL